MRFIFILLVIFSEYSNASSIDDAIEQNRQVELEYRMDRLEQQRNSDYAIRQWDEVDTKIHTY